MSTLLKVDELEALLGKNKNHVVGRVIDILPFNTKRTKAIRGNFNDALGDYVRNIGGLQLVDRKNKDEDILTSLRDPFVGQIMGEIEYTEDAEYDLERFLNQYLFGHDNKIKPIHPYLFNYIPVSGKNDLQKYAQFAKDVLVYDEVSISSIFNNKESEDILTELILNKLDIPSKDTVVQYQPLIGFLSNLYQEDLLFLSEYKDYFLKSFPLLTHFYSFMYVCQLVMKFEQFDEANYSYSNPLYFALEWESISKRRTAADDLEGFRRIKEKAPNLYVHLNTMSQLSYNEFQDNKVDAKKDFRFMTYSELKKVVKEQGEKASEQLLDDIKEWINRYSHIFSSRVTPKEEPKDLNQAFRTLFSCVQEGTNTEACESCGGNIEDLGAGVFLKNRGSIGLVLNMSHEMLLLLTAVCVKEDRMPLNRLFEEFSKRGVAFDRHSKKVIIELFDSHNILDKKSDSGDAQYVKRIL
ncbi:DNA phosphorothioation-dependent restriction protein DptG [Bacillus pseudomycoides]|uniref:DNA phosphorothioation-dependent restriction protein DptG n=1 Tax=Bacillus pseudomycoides TaxID=64104 RepID=UPI002B486B86|nr:DNA phosphorothioation-dependent restriction protein DptG [Bacillus pseudomycoides]MEB3055044.1 DNA phosphorothioation-dependent restriction protein DptG [Bacillus pseudomycoides]